MYRGLEFEGLKINIFRDYQINLNYDQIRNRDQFLADNNFANYYLIIELSTLTEEKKLPV